MTNSSGKNPRFGKDFLFNWLAAPADKPDIVIERQLAMSVLKRGKPTVDISAFGYSRKDWSLEHNGVTATLSFQNFAQREGSNPRQFAAYTLTVFAQPESKTEQPVCLLRSVHEQAYKYGTNIPCGKTDKTSIDNQHILGGLKTEQPKQRAVIRLLEPVAA